MTVVAADNSVTCAVYAKENGLLNQSGWKHFKRIAKWEQVLVRMLCQNRLKSVCQSIKYKYGFQVPRDIADARKLDEWSGTTKWMDAVALELAQLDEYDTFKDLGKGATAPEGYTKITVHFNRKQAIFCDNHWSADRHVGQIPNRDRDAAAKAMIHVVIF